MNSNEVDVSIENAWVEFERVGEISHSNADNLLTAVTNIKASNDRMADEIAELREGLKLMIEQFKSEHNCEYEYKIIKWNEELLNK